MYIKFAFSLWQERNGKRKSDAYASENAVKLPVLSHLRMSASITMHFNKLSTMCVRLFTLCWLQNCVHIWGRWHKRKTNVLRKFTEWLSSINQLHGNISSSFANEHTCFGPSNSLLDMIQISRKTTSNNIYTRNNKMKCEKSSNCIEWKIVKWKQKYGSHWWLR